MTVAVSILLAALVGGVVFVLLDNWQRRTATAAPEPKRRQAQAWAPPMAPTGSLFGSAPASRPAPFRDYYADAPTAPLPPEPPTARLPDSITPPPAPPAREAGPPPRPARPLWDDPPGDDEDRPPGLWSGWARH